MTVNNLWHGPHLLCQCCVWKHSLSCQCCPVTCLVPWLFTLIRNVYRLQLLHFMFGHRTVFLILRSLEFLRKTVLYINEILPFTSIILPIPKMSVIKKKDLKPKLNSWDLININEYFQFVFHVSHTCTKALLCIYWRWSSRIFLQTGWGHLDLILKRSCSIQAQLLAVKALNNYQIRVLYFVNIKFL